MAPTTLVGPDINGGRELVAALEQDGMPIAAAFWYQAEGMSDWRLLLASPFVDQEGSLSAYRRIHQALARLPRVHMPVGTLVAARTVDRRVLALHAAAPATESSFFGMYLPDLPPEYGPASTVYVYRA